MDRRRLLACLQALPAWALLDAAPLAAQPVATSKAASSRRIALVVGNARYGQSPLANPENDARLVTQTLLSLGFEVADHYNLTAREFKRVLRDFGRRMDDDENASVFFYAGHGMQIDRRNYLLPVDLNLRDEGEIKDEAIDLEEALLSRIDRVRPRARIFIIDACRDNPFAARTRSVRSTAGLAEMAAPGALIAFSAAPGRTAEDGPPGTNSLFTKHLVAEMRVEGVEVETMLKNVRVKVLRETQERQLPFLSSSMVVNFVFNPGLGAAVSAGSRPTPAVTSAPRETAAGARSLRLGIEAQRQLNTDSRQTSASLAVRVYVLRDAQGFQRASFDSLYDNDEAALGASLIKRESLHLRPGESRELLVELGREARVVAVFAAYREVERSQWRAVLALPADDAVPPARLEAQARQVLLGWAR
jgi:type VI secretion system VasD/TssJ family lipoprotein